MQNLNEHFLLTIVQLLEGAVRPCQQIIYTAVVLVYGIVLFAQFVRVLLPTSFRLESSCFGHRPSMEMLEMEEYLESWRGL